MIPVCANEEEHKQAYFAAEQYFKETYKIKVDPANKDVRRVCYFSHDPQLKTKFDAVPLDIKKWSPDTKQSSESSTAETTRTTTSKSPQTKIEYEEPTEEQWEDIFNHIQNPDDRDVWIEVGLATKEHFGDAGYQRWANWSKQSSKWGKIEESEHRKKWVDDFKPTNIKGIAKLIYLARQGGWSGAKTKGPQKNPAQEEEETSTSAETEATETDSAKETTPNATTGSDAGQTTKGNFHIEKNKSGEDVYVPNQPQHQ